MDSSPAARPTTICTRESGIVRTGSRLRQADSGVALDAAGSASGAALASGSEGVTSGISLMAGGRPEQRRYQTANRPELQGLPAVGDHKLAI